MAALSSHTWLNLLEEHDDGWSIIAIVDRDFILRAASERAQEAFQLSYDEVVGTSVADLIHDGDLSRALGAFTETTAHEGLRPPDVYRIRQGPETYKRFDVSGENVLDGAAVVFRLREVDERRRAETLAVEQIEVLELLSAGRSRNECLTALANLCERHVDGGLAIVHVPGPDGRLEPITTGRIRNLIRNRWRGASLAEPGGNLTEAGHRGLSLIELAITDLPHWNEVAGSLEQSGYLSCITTPALTPNGALAGYLEVLRQSSEKPHNAEMAVHVLVSRLIGLIIDRMTFEAALSEAAFCDDLTGLGNRRHMQEEMQALADRNEPFGLLGIDLDQFAWINNNLGHAAGDQLLVEVSERLRANLPDNATAYRPGGDEFVVIVENERRAEDLVAIARNLLTVLREPILIGTTERRVNASIGIAKSLNEEIDPERVLARADAAMYAAKREGGAGVRLFSEPIGQQMMRRMALADELRGAIDKNELRLVYQPVIRLDTLEVAGVEALVRWEHPTHGLLGPDEFVPIAEESTLILELDEWVLHEAGRQLVIWTENRSSDSPLNLWVNLSARSFVRPDLTRILGQVSPPTAAGRLGLELTERDPVEDMEGAIAAFESLRRADVPIAIDDFGVGRASLHRVADFEPTTLKIDRSFVNRMVVSQKFRTVVEVIIEVARRFDLTVTAEGVEQESQLAVLQELGCHHGQGFLFARPMVTSDLETTFGPRLDRRWTPPPPTPSVS